MDLPRLVYMLNGLTDNLANAKEWSFGTSRCLLLPTLQRNAQPGYRSPPRQNGMRN